MLLYWYTLAYGFNDNKPLKMVLLDCKAYSTRNRRQTQTYGRTDGHHPSISRNCFAIRPKTLMQRLTRLTKILTDGTTDRHN